MGLPVGPGASGRGAGTLAGGLQQAVLTDYYGDEVLERPVQLVVPTADFAELHDAEIEEERLQLGLQHVQDVVLVTGAVADCL